MANHEVRARRSMGEWKIRSVPVRLSSVLLTTALMLLAGCGPPYLADTYATSTQKPASLDTNSLARVPVVVLGFMASGTLQGLAPTMSHALSGALAEVNPPISEISTHETMNRLTDKGLVAEYADMRAGFARNGMLDRQQLRRIGSGLGSQYVLLPGLAQLEEEILDKYRSGRDKAGPKQGNHVAVVVATLGRPDRSHRLGVVWRRHHIHCVSEP